MSSRSRSRSRRPAVLPAATFVASAALTLLLMTVLLLPASCRRTTDRPGEPEPSTTKAAAPSAPAFPPVPGEHLHNAHVVTDKVISGAQPDGEASFQALRDLGVKTIISVDGARPDADTARKYGMRYVHLPIGYDGVDAAEGRAIAKAIEELPGPVYVHCHHGKHRSAAAVAVACVYNGMLAPGQVESVLKTFGTGENYKGLWQAARDARPLDPAELAAFEVDYAEAAAVPELAEAMVALDKHWEHMKQIRDAGWKVPADHPDLDPAHEALQVREHLREMGRTESVRARPEEFRRMLLEGEDASAALEEALAAEPVDAERAADAFGRVANSCTACHKAYRD